MWVSRCYDSQVNSVGHLDAKKLATLFLCIYNMVSSIPLIASLISYLCFCNIYIICFCFKVIFRDFFFFFYHRVLKISLFCQLHCHAMQCRSVKWRLVHYSAMHFSSIQCSKVQSSVIITVQCNAMQLSSVKCSELQWSVVQCSSV